MLAVAIFVAAALAFWVGAVAVGFRAAIRATPWIILGGGFVLPGLTDAAVPISAAWLAGLGLLLDRNMTQSVSRPVRKPALLFGVLLVLLALVAARSPDRGQGARMVVQGAFAFLAAALFACGTQHVKRALLLKDVLMAGVVTAVAIGAFRIWPNVEMAFLRSRLAGLLIEPHMLRETVAGYWEQGNNVLDTAKAGFVFVNANVASALLCLQFGIVAGLVRLESPPNWIWPAGVIVALGIVATGSRIGILCLTAMTLAGVAPSRGARGTRLLPFATMVLGIVALGLFAGKGTDRYGLTAVLGDPRLVLWPMAVEHILDAPILGSGFGSWEAWLGARLQLVGIGRVFPPHNIVLHFALWGGAILTLFGGYLLVGVVRLLWQRHREGGDEAAYAFGGMLGLAAILLHSAVDNFFLFEWHVGPTLFGILAIVLATKGVSTVQAPPSPVPPAARVPE